jgi:type IV secretory pathway TrbD component
MDDFIETVWTLALLGLALWIVVTCLASGMDKTLGIRERTHYDTEIGRTVYVEKGV